MLLRATAIRGSTALLINRIDSDNINKIDVKASIIALGPTFHQNRPPQPGARPPARALPVRKGRQRQRERGGEESRPVVCCRRPRHARGGRLLRQGVGYTPHCPSSSQVSIHSARQSPLRVPRFTRTNRRVHTGVGYVWGGGFRYISGGRGGKGWGGGRGGGGLLRHCCAQNAAQSRLQRGSCQAGYGCGRAGGWVGAKRQSGALSESVRVRPDAVCRLAIRPSLSRA